MQLILSNNDSSFELSINEMFNQLNKKLIKQDEQLEKEINPNSPLIIQRKQLQKDIDDFHLLNQRKDARAIQQIIQRVEHMAMFNRKSIPSSSISLSPKPSPISCSYWVCVNFDLIELFE